MIFAAGSTASGFLQSSGALLLALFAFLGTGAVYLVGAFRSARNTSTLQSLNNSLLARKEENELLESKVRALEHDQEKKEAKYRSDLADRDQQIRELTGRVAVLQDTVTGKQAIDELRERTEALAEANRDAIAANDAKLAEVLSLTGDLRADLRALARELTGHQPRTRRPAEGAT